MYNQGTIILTNGRLLDCIGDGPVNASSVVIEKGKIGKVYSGQESFPTGVKIIDVGGRTILPGLIDGHIHVAFAHPDLQTQIRRPDIVNALWIKDNCERILQTGFTTVADMGLANLALKEAIENGLIKGPRLLICNTLLTPTGGHVDRLNIAGYPYPPESRLYSLPRIVDGVDDARKAAREQLRAGADYLKVTCSRSIVSPQIEFSEGELRAIAEEAKDKGKYVHAHDEGYEGAKRALKSGVKVVEHISFCDSELIEIMKERGAFYMPTLALKLKAILEMSEHFPLTPHLLAQKEVIKRKLPTILRTVETIFHSGIPVGSGSDCIAGMPLEGWEIKLKTDCGMTPYEALKSATAVNARIFQMEDEIGTIEPGKSADIIVVDGQPDKDPSLLACSDNVRLVMKQGEIFKNTLKGEERNG
jgi:imidazolonepropionase-like amidohydrolase